MGIDDALNPGIDEDLGADNTGLMRAVQRRAFGGHAVYSRLDDGICSAWIPRQSSWF